MSLTKSKYRAPWWIPGGHLQTILPAELFPKPKVEYRREIWDTPDGDIVAADWSQPEPKDPKAPIMVHFHGLEGSSQSHYARSLMAECAARGVRGIVIHYRGCGGIDNLKPRAYFAGDAQELDWEFARVKALFPEAPVYAMGVSLGANNLLYWAGTRGDRAADFVKSVVSICSPLDLAKSGEVIGRGLSPIYEKNFLWTLKKKAFAKLKEYPGLFDGEKLARVKRIYEYDDMVTAPMHGFKDWKDYYEQCSSIRQLSNIRVPTLVLNAKNDPIVGYELLPNETSVSPSVTLEYPATGGHCGFPHADIGRGTGFLPARTFEFCQNFH